MSRAMLRLIVVVNDQPQDFTIGGDPVYVASTRLGVGPNAQHAVEFWTEGEIPDGRPSGEQLDRHRTYQVFGTGHPLPHQAVWRGTCARTAEGLVWHLYELLPAEAAVPDDAG